MTDKLGNTDRPDGPVVYPGTIKDLNGRMEVVETRLDEFEKALHVLIDGLEDALGVRAGLKDSKREY